MMPGMAPPGPPGAYMPAPFMQHMPYPPGMPPPNGESVLFALSKPWLTSGLSEAMYSPAMGQMPRQ